MSSCRTPGKSNSTARFLPIDDLIQRICNNKSDYFRHILLFLDTLLLIFKERTEIGEVKLGLTPLLEELKKAEDRDLNILNALKGLRLEISTLSSQIRIIFQKF